MSNLVDLERWKKAKARKAELEPYLKELDKLSDFLYNHLHLRLSFSILEVIEEVRVQYYMEVIDCDRILNTADKVIKLKKDLK